MNVITFEPSEYCLKSSKIIAWPIDVLNNPNSSEFNFSICNNSSTLFDIQHYSFLAISSFSFNIPGKQATYIVKR